MKVFKSILIFVFILGLLGCEEEPKIADTVSTFYFIRHAEKDRSDSENIDPELTQKGLGRAMHWAEILDEVPIDAIYSTDYERTQMTAAPMAVKKNLTVQIYDPRLIDIEQFKAENLNKKVFIVGHSNSTPEFVNKMIGQDKYGLIDDHQNGSLFIVEIINGIATDMRLNFNCNCPD
ncbi:histidine phosphatase family protein [Maribacter arenosus]|uniref:Histidine phosphatase family protein n=2 Tax=Maribacter arenosus TaxID=1854708 RepID=A0ABR7V9C4_9FLAO|nr:histidine phosphatase family protein [Maribacter arenosus]